MNKIVAFVTGGSSGLGAATVSNLIRKGAAGCYVLDTQRYQNIDRLSNVYSFQGSVENEEHITKALDDCYDKFKKINLVVNCAGVSVAYKIYNFNTNQPQNRKDFDKVLAINVGGTFNVNRLACRYLAMNDDGDERGLIINVSSAAATEGQTGHVTLAATSGAINSMTLPMARDLAPQKIRVNCIQPGFFETPLVTHLPQNIVEYLGYCCLMPSRIGKPEEFAHAVEMLVENKYINAEIIRLDAGLRIPP